MGLLLQAWHRAFPGAWAFSACPPEGDCISPGFYAVIGAAAMLGGVTRMTSTSNNLRMAILDSFHFSINRCHFVRGKFLLVICLTSAYSRVLQLTGALSHVVSSLDS